MIIEPPQTNKKQQQIPWIEKYRPSSLDEVIAHEEIINTIQKFRTENRLPNLLLYGPPGTGKTSTIIALAKQMYAKSYSQMVLELNASDERGISTVRETIKRFAESQQFSFTKDKSGFSVKLVILDEADSMTSAAQFALRRSKGCKLQLFKLLKNLPKQPDFALFAIMFLRQSLHSKVDVQDLSSSRYPLSVVVKGCQIFAKEREATFKLCDGDMRRIVNMLQSLYMSSHGPDNSLKNLITAEQVYQFTGMADPKQIEQILKLLFTTSQVNEAYKEIKQILETYGISMQLLLKEINGILLTLDLPNEMKMFLVQRMSELEYRLSLSCNENIQLLALIGAFQESRVARKD